MVVDIAIVWAMGQFSTSPHAEELRLSHNFTSGCRPQQKKQVKLPTVLHSSTADSISDIIIGIGSPPQSHHQEEQELQSLHLANGVAGLLAVELMDRKEEGHHTEKWEKLKLLLADRWQMAAFHTTYVYSTFTSSSSRGTNYKLNQLLFNLK
jgi:hypothetical protein